MACARWLAALLFISVFFVASADLSQSNSSSACPPPIWPLAVACSGNADSCSENRCICKDGYSGLADVVDYSRIGADCPTHIVSREVFVCLAIIMAAVNLIRTYLFTFVVFPVT